MGHLRIGTSTTLCKYLLLPYLKPFIQTYPHVQISISCQSTAQTLQLLKDGRLDLGLTGSISHPGPLTFEPFAVIEDIFVAAPQYLENLDLRRNSGETFFDSAVFMLLDQENLSRQHIDAYFQKNNLQPGHLLEVSSMDLLIDFARIGLGAGCVIKNFVKKELDNGTFVELPLDIPIPNRSIGFVWGSQTPNSKALDMFIKFYRHFYLK